MPRLDTEVLSLSSAEELAEWTGSQIDARLVGSLHAAREVISSRVLLSVTDDSIPAALHRACTMMAAAYLERIDSTYGVESFAVGGEAGVGFLTSDPTVNALIAPYRRFSLAGN